MAKIESPRLRRCKTTLKIHAAPFKPTFLSIPPSPFSPLSPLSPQRHVLTSSTYKSSCNSSTSASTTCSELHSTRTSLTPATSSVSSTPTRGLPSPPHYPLRWLWQCHMCHRTYGLGVTRRCLNDGHLFCTGTTVIQNWREQVNPRNKNQSEGRKLIKHRACGSEFDYVGWKTWGCWRRSASFQKGARESDEKSCTGEFQVSTTFPWLSVTSLESSFPSSSLSSCALSPETAMPTPDSNLAEGLGYGKKTIQEPKNCWEKCDYPSECRWGRQLGTQSPVEVALPTVTANPIAKEEGSPTQNATPASSASVDTMSEPRNIQKPTSWLKSPIKESWSDKGTGDFWGTLLASATRRKATLPTSPLASVVEDHGAEEPQAPIVMESAIGTSKRSSEDEKGDCVMFSPQSSPSSTEPSPMTVDPRHLMWTSTVREAVTESIQTAAMAPVTSLKDAIGMFRKKSSKRRQSQRRRLEAQTHPETSFKVEYPQGPKHSGGDNDDDTTDMVPLHRVRSRDIGYYGHLSVGKM